MEKYVLQSDEVLLYENHVYIKDINNASVNLILTNFCVVLEITQKIGFFINCKYETTLEKYLLNDIKFYNEKPQIIQKKDKVTLFFTSKELEIGFSSFFAASKFAGKAIEAVTGIGTATRGAGKVKKAIGLVDDTLGINVTSTIAGVVENGVVKTLFKGTGKSAVAKSRLNNSADTVSSVANAVTAVSKTLKETNNDETARPLEQRVEEVKKLKELLDIGAISQEEFDAKKKEILGL